MNLATLTTERGTVESSRMGREAMDVRPRNPKGDKASTQVVDLAVKVRDMHKSFESVHALNGVSFDVPRGGVLGILGPNGAGKTTLVDVLCTLIQPDSGSAQVCGHDLIDDPAGVLLRCLRDEADLRGGQCERHPNQLPEPRQRGLVWPDAGGPCAHGVPV